MLSKNLLGVVLLCVFAAVRVAGQVSLRSQEGNKKAAGSYQPLAVGNWWSYSLKVDSRKVRRVKWEVTQKEMVDGVPVYYLWLTPPEGDEPLKLSPGTSDLMEPPDRVLLKSSMHAGDRWSSGAQGKTDSFEVMSVGRPCAAGGYNFLDCAVILEVFEETRSSTITTYARGVGPVIHAYFKDQESKQMQSTMTIRSWHLKSAGNE